MEQAFGLSIPRTLEDVCDPTRVALIIYDMQAGIVSQLPDGGTIVQRVAEIRQAARDAGVRVFYTRHLSLPKEVAGMTQLRTAMAWQHVDRVAEVKPRFLRDSPGFQITPELAPSSTEAVFDKITMSAFEGTPLDIALRDCGINSFIIVGVATEIGIEPTVRHGADLGYIPIVVTDACGAGHPEAGERALASIKFMGDAMLADLQTIQRVLGRRRSA